MSLNLSAFNHRWLVWLYNELRNWERILKHGIGREVKLCWRTLYMNMWLLVYLNQEWITGKKEC